MYSILYFLPSTSTPPAALISSIAIFSVSTKVDSEIAMVPVSECRMPTVTLSSYSTFEAVLSSPPQAVTARPSEAAAMPAKRRLEREVLIQSKTRKTRLMAIEGRYGSTAPLFRIKTNQTSGSLKKHQPFGSCCNTKSTTWSKPTPFFRLVKHQGRSPRMRLVSCSITDKSAPTKGAKSILLITKRSDRVIPGPPFRGILSPAATSIT